MLHVLNVWIYECCSKIVGIKVKYKKFIAGLSTDASASQPTKRRTVHFDVKTIEIRDREETPSTNSRRNMPTDKTLTFVSDCVAAAKTTLSSSCKSVHHATSEEKWDEMKSFLHSYQ
ncbi:hypothetical protein P3S67_014541 [Capsicum chacoense]